METMSAIAVNMQGIHKDQQVDWDPQPAIHHIWTSRQEVAHACCLIH